MANTRTMNGQVALFAISASLFLLLVPPITSQNVTLAPTNSTSTFSANLTTIVTSTTPRSVTSSTTKSPTTSAAPTTRAPVPPAPTTSTVTSTAALANQIVRNATQTTSSSNSSSTLSQANIIIAEHIDTNDTSSRRAGNASKNALFDTLTDFMPENIRNNGGVIVHILLLAYICLALGIVCDIYFLSSLEFISNGLKLPADIAGATFMAIGTSAPELFTSLIGVFISQDDIGTGTILGSAVFNIIFIPAVCGFAVWKWCDTTPKVSKFAILRDTIFYLITIVTLLLALKDNEIDWIESTAMLGLFTIYIIIMYFNAQVSELLQTKDDPDEDSNESTPLLTGANAVLVQSTRGEEWEVGSKGGEPSRPRFSSITGEGEPDEENWVEASTLTKVVMFPALILFKITLPKATKYCFFLTFIVSILWISVLTYAAVWLVTIIGYTFGVPETISGLTLLAAGTSIPELISSVLVVKRAGLADMALCNTIGSNIFDILVGLGLPWTIKAVINMASLGTLDTALTMVPVQSTGLPFTTFSLLLTVIGMIGTLSFFKWRLGLGVGFSCTAIYIVFLVVSSVFEIVFN